MTIRRNQLLPPDFFCQREGCAGEGFGLRPLFAVEGEFCQVACVNGNAFLIIVFLRNAQGFAVVALGGGVVLVGAFRPSQVVQRAGDIVAFGGEGAADFQHFAVGGDGGGVVLSQFVTDSAQSDGDGFLARRGVFPVGCGAGGAGQDFVRLVAGVIRHPRLVGAPARLVFIPRREGA